MKQFLFQRVWKFQERFSAFGRSLRYRPAANSAVAKICKLADSQVNGEILCEALWDNPLHWLRVAMLRNALAADYGSNLVGVYEENSRCEWVESLRALGITDEVVIETSLPTKYLEIADSMLADVSNSRDLCSLEFPRGYPACYFYDGVLKINKVGRADQHTPCIRDYLARTLKYLDDFEKIIKSRNITAAISSHYTHFRNSTLVWLLIQNNIPVFLAHHFSGHHSVRVMTDSSHMLKPYDDVPTLQELLSFTSEQRKRVSDAGKLYLDKVRQGKEGQVSRVNVYGDGNLKFRSRDEFVKYIQADPQKPIVVIMGNCWGDFPNAYGPSWYTDYLDWFFTTIQIAKTIPSCSWLLKPHPAEQEYGDTRLVELIKKPLPKGMYIWPNEANGTEIGAYAYCLVTARSSSAVEYTAAGKRVIVGAPSAYTPLEFVNYATTRDQYKNLLNSIKSLSPPTPRQIEVAQIYAGLVHADGSDKERLRYPYATGQSFNLYKKMPQFINQNWEKIQQEIDIMKQWSRSGHTRYNTYRAIEYFSK